MEKKLVITDDSYLLIPRGILSFSFSHRPARRHLFRLFCAIYSLCCYNRSSRNFNRQEILCKRGQITTSTRQLAEITDFSHSKVHKLIADLKKHNWITVEVKGKVSLITVIDYDKMARFVPKEEKRNSKKTSPAPTPKEEEPELTPEQLQDREEVLRLIREKKEKRKRHRPFN